MSKEIKGVDPKTYGGFDKFMDKVQKVSKHVFPVLGASLTAGCSAEMIDAIVKTSQAGETAPLPSDFTKTHELSLTDATYEVTSTPEHESTINPPTEVVTEMPTASPTPEPTPTATEKPLIEGNIFFDPQSETDFDKVVESPSPIDNPEEFAVWQDEYLRQVNERLENYDGVGVNTEIMGLSWGSSTIIVDSKEWPVIASYKFNWSGQEILTKTYIFNLTIPEGYIPISITYPPPDSVLFDQEMRYRTPSESKLLSLDMFYELNDSVRNSIGDEFMKSFLPSENENFNSLRNVFGKRGDEEDIENVTRSVFLMTRFY